MPTQRRAELALLCTVQLAPDNRDLPPDDAFVDSAAMPAARCKKVRRGSFILNLPSHYSITSSARVRSVGGTSRPSAFAVVRCIREVKPPLSPENVIAEFVSVLKSYHCHKVTGDRYGGEFPREQFRKRGITYNVSERVKSDIYVDFLPLLNSGRVMLPGCVMPDRWRSRSL
jgi:hypothetical protein